MRKIFSPPRAALPHPFGSTCFSRHARVSSISRYRAATMISETAKSDESGDVGESDDAKARNFLPQAEKANSGRSRVPEWLESNREMYLHFEIMGRGMHKVILSFWDCPLAHSCRVVTFRCPDAVCNCSMSIGECMRRWAIQNHSTPWPCRQPRSCGYVCSP